MARKIREAVAGPAVQRVGIDSARLVTFDEHDPIWNGAFCAVDVHGALVRLVPNPDCTVSMVQSIKAQLESVGALAVHVQPNGRRRANPDSGDRSPVAPVPTVRQVVGQMVEEAHCEGFDRDELRDAVEQALCAEGL